jgi:hypothetical protein
MKAIQEIESYLATVLGLRQPDLRPCPQAVQLPFYLQDAFEFRNVVLAGHTVALAIEKEGQQHKLREVRVQVARIRELLDLPVIYCVQALAAYQRRNLIAQKVPFMVPGNQLYLPDLGIDLREYFLRAPKSHLSAYSPSTQALLIAHLLKVPLTQEWSASEVALALGYTPMSATRAMKELVHTEVAELVTAGRAKRLRLVGSPRQALERAMPYLRSPVKRTAWAMGPLCAQDSRARLAGLSALAAQTALQPPNRQCLAMTLEQWRHERACGLREIPGPEANSIELQIWAYAPAPQANSRMVDPLSLWLSLKDTDDERVQLALDAIKEQWPW